MNNVTIFGEFNTIEYIYDQDFEIAMGFDDNGELFFRFYSNIDLQSLILSSGYELYYRSLCDLYIDTFHTIEELKMRNRFSRDYTLELLLNFYEELPQINAKLTIA